MRWSVLLALVACGGGDPAVSPDAPPSDAPPDGPSGCPRTPAAEDRDRFVVVSHPYDADGMPAATFEVLALSASGELTRPGNTFTLGRAAFGTIAFTPDGEIGLVALDDGTLGVFRLDPSGVATVVDPGFAGAFYASRVIVEPRGDRALIVDRNTRENGGGVYLVTIGCDGALTDHGLIAPGTTPGGVAFLDGERALIAGPVEGAPAGEDVSLVRLGDPTARLAGVDAFGDDLAIIGGSALTHDGATYLVGDTSIASVPNRVAAVAIEGDALVAGPVLELEDPQAIAASPFGDVAVVASAFGDALFVLDAGGAGGAWRVRGEVAYTGAGPALPGDLATIDRGALRGHVFVSENVSVRHLAFDPDGTGVTDLGSLAFGSGLANIGGAIGVTP